MFFGVVKILKFTHSIRKKCAKCMKLSQTLMRLFNYFLKKQEILKSAYAKAVAFGHFLINRLKGKSHTPIPDLRALFKMYDRSGFVF